MSEIILGIETSCDDTCVAIMSGDKLLIHMAASQDHNKYGGILPEYAARNHMQALPKLVECALAESGLSLAQLDCISVTSMPGLLGSLMVGASYAKGLAYSLNKPIIAIHHIEGHILMAKFQFGLEFPFGALVVSGGHSLLAIAEGLGRYKLLGTTLDDSCGECFDKVARKLNLPQPGGPHIEKLAKTGSPTVPLPIPLHKDGSCNFSFSGLKTATIRFEAEPADVAASLQNAVGLTLAERLKNAISRNPEVKNWALVGGVASNLYIRSYLEHCLTELSCNIYCPMGKYCVDNGVMPAYTGLLYYRAGKFSELDFKPKSICRLDELSY